MHQCAVRGLNIDEYYNNIILFIHREELFVMDGAKKVARATFLRYCKGNGKYNFLRQDTEKQFMLFNDLSSSCTMNGHATLPSLT